MTMMANKNPSIYISKERASLFFPSRYHKIGRPKISEPVTAAENTKSSSIAMGASAVSGPSGLNVFDT